MSSSSASSAVTIFFDPDTNEEQVEFTLPLPDKGDVEGECEWYRQLYWHHYWIKTMQFPKQTVIIDTDLLRAYFTRFAPHIYYDNFFKPGSHYTLGPPCDIIGLFSEGWRVERFETIRRQAAAVIPPGIAEAIGKRQVSHAAIQ